MYNAASMMEMLHDAPGYGITAPVQAFDWKLLKTKRDAYVARLVAIYDGNIAKWNIAKISGHAAFEGPSTVVVNGERYTAPHIVVAVGGAPTMPPIPGIEHAINSDGFFDLEALPKKAAIVGAGYIAVELAGILRALGTEVHLLLRHDELLRSFDHSVRAQLMDEMGKPDAFVHIHKQAHVRAAFWTFGAGQKMTNRSPNPPPAALLLNRQPTAVTLGPDGATRTLHYSQGGRPAAALDNLDTVIFAIGRHPLTQSLNLAAAVRRGCLALVVVLVWCVKAAPGVTAGPCGGRTWPRTATATFSWTRSRTRRRPAFTPSATCAAKCS